MVLEGELVSPGAYTLRVVVGESTSEGVRICMKKVLGCSFFGKC